MEVNDGTLKIRRDVEATDADYRVDFPDADRDGDVTYPDLYYDPDE